MAAAAALRPDEEKLYEGQPRGFPLEGFEVEDVMLPEDDDMGIPSEDEGDDEEEIESESGFGSVIGARPPPCTGAGAGGARAARGGHARSCSAVLAPLDASAAGAHAPGRLCFSDA
jgi:hypothetical protein